MSGFLVNKSLLDPTVTQYSGGTASFTLPQSGSTNSTEVFVGGVPQVAGVDFNIAGTALTLTTSAPAGSNMVCARQYFSDGITGTAGANTVATAAIQNDSVTGGKLNPALVAGDIIYADGTDTINRLAKGAALQTLQMNAGATAPNWVTASAGFTLGTEQATTSGTSITFSSIPAGVTNIDVMFHEVSTDNTALGNAIFVQIGDAGGIETSGYLSSSSGIDAGYIYSRHDTAGFNVLTINYITAAEELISGAMSLHLEDATNNSWVMSGTFKQAAEDNAGMITSGGSKSLSAELTQLKVLHEASANFDAGAINIKYM